MIPITKPLLDQAEAEAAAAVVRSGWLSQGAEVARFEAEFAAFVGASHACAVSNCTSALHLALLAAGVVPDDEVITVSHSFIATANAVRQCGAVPVFVDIDPATFNIDPDLVPRAITRRTKAILCPHQIGLPADLARILAVARAHGLLVIEDAACAVGSQIHLAEQWETIGAPHGDVACFSFHPRKLVTTGEGGMLVTRHAEWDRLFRLWRQHGMSVPDTVRHASPQVVFEQYPVCGFNYRMTDVQAAIGRVQLRRLPEHIARRRALVGRYRDMLADIHGIHVPVEPEWCRSNWQSLCVRLPADSDQRQVMQNMLDNGVSTRRGVMCAHLEPAFANQPLQFQLPESERAHRQAVLLPLFPQMTEEVQATVVEVFRRALCVSAVRPYRQVAMSDKAAPSAAATI